MRKINAVIYLPEVLDGVGWLEEQVALQDEYTFYWMFSLFDFSQSKLLRELFELKRQYVCLSGSGRKRMLVSTLSYLLLFKANSCQVMSAHLPLHAGR